MTHAWSIPSIAARDPDLPEAPMRWWWWWWWGSWVGLSSFLMSSPYFTFSNHPFLWETPPDLVQAPFSSSHM